MINICFANYHLSVAVPHNCLHNTPDVLSKCKNTHICLLLHCDFILWYLLDQDFSQNYFSNYEINVNGLPKNIKMGLDKSRKSNLSSDISGLMWSQWQPYWPLIQICHDCQFLFCISSYSRSMSDCAYSEICFHSLGSITDMSNRKNQNYNTRFHSRNSVFCFVFWEENQWSLCRHWDELDHLGVS